jgi:hypothetical protein
VGHGNRKMIYIVEMSMFKLEKKFRVKNTQTIWRESDGNYKKGDWNC